MTRNSKVLFKKMKQTLSEMNVKRWKDISAVLESVKRDSPEIEAFTDKEFLSALHNGIAFMTYDFGIDGVSIEISKYAHCMEKIFTDAHTTLPVLHFISGDFYDKADSVLKPYWNRFHIREMNGWAKWHDGKWFSKLFYEDIPEGSKVSSDIAVEMWSQIVSFAEELGSYVVDKNIALLFPVNIFSNPGNFAIAIATILVSESLGMYVLNSNHDFYWEGGKPISERNPGEKAGVRDHFFRNIKNRAFFSLFKTLYPWNGKRWIQVNINHKQSRYLITHYGFPENRVFDLSTFISDEFLREYTKQDVVSSRRRMTYILSDGKSKISPIPVSKHVTNLKNWMKEQKPTVCGFREGLELDLTSKKIIYCLQPTRVIARKRIEKDLHLFSALMNYPDFRMKFESNKDLQLVLHITGPVPIEHQADLETVLGAYTDLCLALPKDISDRIFIAFSVGTEEHPSFKVNGLKRMHIEDIYRLATVVLFPSETEGRGLPIIESSACGIPIICSRYYPEEVFANVIGKNLPEDKQIKYIPFPENDFSHDFLGKVTKLMFGENEEELKKHNREAVRMRYGTEVLAETFYELLKTLKKSKN